mgnify:CR=1 FL=1|tara:strand:+ start:80 stop:283 length:204 start_codon:yes stop_codon:yes gene_type:complete
MSDAEDNVVFLPYRARINDDNLEFVIRSESEVTERLSEIHGDITSVPVNKLGRLDAIMNALEDLLRS